MSEDTQAQPTNDTPAVTPAVDTPAAVPTQTDTTTSTTEHMIPKSRFDEINTKYKAMVAAQEKAAKDKEAAELKALEEQNNFKKLYEQAQAKQREAEAKASKLAHDALRKQIATDAGHPKLWNRIQGDNEETLKADMQSLIEAMPKPTAPNLNGGAGGGSRGKDGKQYTSDEVRELAVTYNVSPEILAQTLGIKL